MPRPFVVSVISSVAAASFAAARAQTPPGYEIIQVTPNGDVATDLVPQINSRGQIVWEERVDGTDESGEIFLYDAGQTTRLTADNVRDAFPDINDAGEVVWSRFMGPDGPYGPTSEIMHHHNGVTTQITADGEDDFAPRINNVGQFVWDSSVGGEYKQANVHLFSEGNINRLTDGLIENRSNQSPKINDVGQIVWTRYDFSTNPWQSEIRLYEAGASRTISRPNTTQLQLPAINKLGHVVWHYNDYTTSQHLQLWNGTKVLDLTYGRNPRINDHGQIYFIRWHEFGGWQAWLYANPGFYQLTSDPFWHTDGDINNNGEIAWMSGGFPESGIRYMRRMFGDMNCDGTLDGFDVDPFVLALSNPSEYLNTFPDCNRDLADANKDGSVNGFDVESFIALLNESP